MQTRREFLTKGFVLALGLPTLQKIEKFGKELSLPGFTETRPLTDDIELMHIGEYFNRIKHINSVGLAFVGFADQEYGKRTGASIVKNQRGELLLQTIKHVVTEFSLES